MKIDLLRRVVEVRSLWYNFGAGDVGARGNIDSFKSGNM